MREVRCTTMVHLGMCSVGALAASRGGRAWPCGHWTKSQRQCQSVVDFENIFSLSADLYRRSMLYVTSQLSARDRAYYHSTLGRRAYSSYRTPRTAARPKARAPLCWFRVLTAEPAWVMVRVRVRVRVRVIRGWARVRIRGTQRRACPCALAGLLG